VIVRAPGKLLLSAPYVVLDGVPAIVLAVARYAEANAADREIPKAAEVYRAYDGKAAPKLRLDHLTDGKRKLGLGSSAAGLVAALGADDHDAGEDLGDPTYRRALFDRAFTIHRETQGGGSGFDVAAAVWGGFFRYELYGPGRARVTNLLWPENLRLELFATGTSARTSEFIAQVNAFRGRQVELAGAMFAALAQASIRASVAFGEGNVKEIVEALTASREILTAIGDAAEVPIVLPQVQRLGAFAAAEGAVFYPSGAGGGDVCVRLGIEPSSPAFIEAAAREGLAPVSISPDSSGVHAASPDSEG
jgi:phosphomevalonate kinase